MLLISRRAFSTRSGGFSHKLGQLYQQTSINLVPKEDLQELWLALERKRYNVNRIKWCAGIIGGTLVLLSGNQIKTWLSHRTSEVTQQSMDDPDFQNKVFELSKSTLTSLLNDPELQSKIQTLTTTTIETSILEIYKNPKFISETEKLVDEVINSKTVIDTSTRLANELINDRKLQEKLGNTIKTSLTIAFMPTYFHPVEENEEKI